MFLRFKGLHPKTGEVMDVCCIDWMHDEVYFEQGTDVSYGIEECSIMQMTDDGSYKDVNLPAQAN